MDTYVATASGIALTASSTKTLLQIATPSTVRATLLELEVGFDGVTSGLPEILVELLRQSSAGTGTSVTPAPLSTAAPASLVTALKAHSAEPGVSTILGSWYVDPHDGKLLLPFYERDRQVVVPVSGWLGVRYTTGAGVTVNAAVNMVFQA
jgi:hypothetical protein